MKTSIKKNTGKTLWMIISGDTMLSPSLKIAAD
jgi:hypothetical protein